MNPVLQSEIQELIETIHYRPAVSIFLPFKPVITSKEILGQQLKASMEEVEHHLLKDFPGEVAILVMQKLHAIVGNLNYYTHKKSIAIYVSPVFEKILYLDIELEPKVVVDELFGIRDLLYSKKQPRDYLVLLVSGRNERIYLGNDTHLSAIVSAPLRPAYLHTNDITDFSKMPERKRIMMEKSLRHTDASLGIIIDAYKLPVFVIGQEKILEHFKKITRHSASAIEYIAGYYEESSVAELQELLAPRINNWEEILQQRLLRKIEEASRKKKLVAGLEETWKEVMNGTGNFLVMERDFLRTAEKTNAFRTLPAPPHSYSKFSYIHHAIDDMIEKVLQNGGDIEFVDNGMLDAYDGIVLLK
ncbi:MAG: hypothetical protein KF746_13295 [Chitinophagaceae bacterium]|nr:hypothetical protein [Chitinophagaceae bacterium]